MVRFTESSKCKPGRKDLEVVKLKKKIDLEFVLLLLISINKENS